MADVTVKESFELKDLAEALIEDAHPHLTGVRILYLVTSREREKCKPIKANYIQRYLSSGIAANVDQGAEFLVIVADDEWNELATPDRQKAFLDHRLYHIAEIEKTDPHTQETVSELRVVDHEIGEFSAVMEKHGAWTPELKTFAQAVRQLRLPLEAPAAVAAG